MSQLTLDLAPRRTPARQLPAIERLRAVLKRSGINWQYRNSTGSTLLRPLLGGAVRLAADVRVLLLRRPCV